MKWFLIFVTKAEAVKLQRGSGVCDLRPVEPASVYFQQEAGGRFEHDGVDDAEAAQAHNRGSKQQVVAEERGPQPLAE